MRLRVNPQACDGFGFCSELANALIALDEWGYPVVGGGDIPTDLVGVAREAVRSCPRRALELVP
ncbi:MAG TPA: ferredoxin [Acidimicrobiales bacterium]|nr:ferredoxin [Acidimicrobiales bacterium]